MKRELLCVFAVLSTVGGMVSNVQADDSGFSLACCRRYFACPSTCCPATTPNVYNEYHEHNEYNVYPRSSSPPVTSAFFCRTPAPQVHMPPNGPDLTTGRTYTIKSNYLCDKPGDVVLYYAGTSHCCEVRSWSPNEVTFEVPIMGAAQPGTIAELRITRPDGVVGVSRVVRLINPPDLIEHEEPAAGSAAAQVGMNPYVGSVLTTANGG